MVLSPRTQDISDKSHPLCIDRSRSLSSYHLTASHFLEVLLRLTNSLVCNWGFLFSSSCVFLRLLFSLHPFPTSLIISRKAQVKQFLIPKGLHVHFFFRTVTCFWVLAHGPPNVLHFSLNSSISNWQNCKTVLIWSELFSRHSTAVTICPCLMCPQELSCSKIKIPRKKILLGWQNEAYD